MRAATIAFGRRVTVTLDSRTKTAKALEALRRAWEREMGKQEYAWCPYLHDVFLASTPQTVEDTTVFDVVFGVSAQWEPVEEPVGSKSVEVGGYVISRFTEEQYADIGYDISSVDNAFSDVTYRVKSAKKGSLGAMTLKRQDRGTTAYLVLDEGTPSARVLWGVPSQQSVLEPESPLVSIETGEASYVLGLELAQVAASDGAAAVKPSNTNALNRQLKKALRSAGVGSEAKGLFVLVHPVVGERSAEASREEVEAPAYAFEATTEPTAMVIAGRRFDGVSLSLARAEAIDREVTKLAADCQLPLRWVTAGASEETSHRMEAHGVSESEVVVVGLALAKADSHEPSKGFTRAHLTKYVKSVRQITDAQWQAVANVIEAARGGDEVDLLVTAMGPLTSAYLAWGSRVAATASAPDGQTVVAGMTTTQDPQSKGVLGVEVAGGHFEMTSSVHSVSAEQLSNLPKLPRAKLHLIASFD